MTKSCNYYHTQKVKVLSLPETIRQNLTFRAKALRVRKIGVEVGENTGVFIRVNTKTSSDKIKGNQMDLKKTKCKQKCKLHCIIYYATSSVSLISTCSEKNLYLHVLFTIPTLATLVRDIIIANGCFHADSLAKIFVY